MKIKTAVLILAEFIEKSTYDRDGDRCPSFIDGAMTCKEIEMDPAQLSEALAVAARVRGRALDGLA